MIRVYECTTTGRYWYEPAELRGHQVAVRTEFRGISVHPAHQLLLAWFLGHGQFVEYLV